MTIAEQLAKLKATREAHQKKMGEIAQKSIDENRSMNTAEKEEFDTLDEEMKQIDGDIERLTRLETVQRATAQPAVPTPAATQVADDGSRTVSTLQLKNAEKVDKGIGFARAARCLALSHIHHQPAEQIARSIYPNDETLHTIVTRAAVPAANTGSPTWASNLINEGGIAFADFVEYTRARSLYGQVRDRLRDDRRVVAQDRAGHVRAQVNPLGHVRHRAEHTEATGVRDGCDDISAVAEREDRIFDAEHVGDLGLHSSSPLIGTSIRT